MRFRLFADSALSDSVQDSPDKIMRDPDLEPHQRFRIIAKKIDRCPIPRERSEFLHQENRRLFAVDLERAKLGDMVRWKYDTPDVSEWLEYNIAVVSPT